MARKPMVTRTLKSTTVVALCMDVVNCEPENKTLTIARTFKDDNSALKVLKDKYETDTLKVVHVVSRTETEELYGMSEEDFIKYADILDKETRKAIEEEEVEQTAEAEQSAEQTTEAEQSAEQTAEAEQSAEQTAEAEQSAEQTAEAEQSAEQGRNRRHNRRR